MCLLPPFVNREVLLYNTITCKSGSDATMNECFDLKK